MRIHLGRWVAPEENLFSGHVYMAEGEEVQDQSPLAEHGAGRASRLACGEKCGMGNEDKVESALG